MNHRLSSSKRRTVAIVISAIGILASVGVAADAIGKNLVVGLGRPNDNNWRDCATGSYIHARGFGYNTSSSTVRCEEYSAGASVVESCPSSVTRHSPSVVRDVVDVTVIGGLPYTESNPYPSQYYSPASNGIQTTW